MVRAKEVEEDLLNTLEESSNEVLELKFKLQQTAEEVNERERIAYEVMNETITKIVILSIIKPTSQAGKVISRASTRAKAVAKAAKGQCGPT